MCFEKYNSASAATKLHNSEEHLSGTEEEKPRDLFEFGPVGYFTLDCDGVVCAANLTGAGFLGVEQPCLLGRQFGDFLPATERVAFIAFLNKVFTSQEVELCEVTMLSERNPPLSVQIEAMSFASKQECLIAMIDVAERR